MSNSRSELINKIRSSITPIPVYMRDKVSRGYVSLIISGSVDRVEFIGGNIQIGWHRYHITYWERHYKNILKSMNYNEETIDEYYEYIKFCDDRYQKIMGAKSGIN